MTTQYQPNAANQYEQIVTGTEVVEPEFDQLGNLLQDDRNIYTWDSDIHLLSVTTKAQGRDGGQTTASFLYDPLHRRIARLENASTLTFFTYNGWNVITEYSITAKGTSPEANHSWTARNTWGEDLSGTHQGASGIGGLLLSVHQPSDFLSGCRLASKIQCFFHYDSNGNVIMLTDAVTQESARYEYDAFGLTRAAEGVCAALNRYRFSTKPTEGGSGLMYYGFRYYDPANGRWLSKDPIRELGGINLYAMANNNSLSHVDAYGLYACSQCNNEFNTCQNICDETLDQAQDASDAWLAAMLASVASNLSSMREFLDDYSAEGLICSLLNNYAQAWNAIAAGEAELGFRATYAAQIAAAAIGYGVCVAACNVTHNLCLQNCAPATPCPLP